MALALGTMLLMLVSVLANEAYLQRRRSGRCLAGRRGRLQRHGGRADRASPVTLLCWQDLKTRPVPGELGSRRRRRGESLDSRAWLDVARLLGVACLSMRTIGGWRLIQRLRFGALVEVPEAVYANFLRLRERLGITRQVSLPVSPNIFKGHSR